MCIRDSPTKKKGSDIDMTTPTINDLWPFFGLTITAPPVRLAYPTDEIIAELVECADDIHSPGASPFMGSWSIDKPEVRARSILQFQWQSRATVSPDKWQLPFAVVIDDEVAGVQDAFAELPPGSSRENRLVAES